MELVERAMSGLGVGEEGVVAGFVGESVANLRLQEMGILKGSKVQLVRKGKFGGPLEVKVRGYRLSLRQEEAEVILIEGKAV